MLTQLLVIVYKINIYNEPTAESYQHLLQSLKTLTVTLLLYCKKPCLMQTKP